MPLHIINVAQKAPHWCETLCSQYLKQIKAFTKISCHTIPISAYHKKNNIEKAKQAEALSISKAIPKDALVINLDEHGEHYTSVQLSKNLNLWQQQRRQIAFVIGGPAGLAPELLQKADVLWALSKLTLPHRLVQVLLLEQLYRAYAILNNHPYHRS